MQSLFLACYFCLQLITVSNHDQAATYCDQCLTGLVEKFHLPSELADEVEDLLSIKKPTYEIVSSNPALAEAIAQLIQQQIASATGSSANQTLINETTIATNISANNPIANANETLTTELPAIDPTANETLPNELPASNETPQKPTVQLGPAVQGLIKPKNTRAPKSFLRVDEKLKVEESLSSKNEKYLATLNNHGELVISTADGTFLEKLGCPSEETNSDYVMLFHRSNQVRFYKSARSARMNSNDYYCTSPYRCSEQVRCYLNLDDDGVLRFYSGDGVLERDYTNRNPNSQNKDNKKGEYMYKGPSILEQNQRLKVGESLVSENGEYKITLNHHGELETYDSDGKIIKNSGTCRGNLRYSDDWNILFSWDNTWHLYPDLKSDRSICDSGSRRDCVQFGGSKCYLKLDNDGLLKLFDDKGNMIKDFDNNKLDGHK